MCPVSLWGQIQTFTTKPHQLTRFSSDQFHLDKHVPNLLVFSPYVNFFAHPLLKEGHILLQDKVLPHLNLQAIVISSNLPVGLYNVWKDT